MDVDIYDNSFNHTDTIIAEWFEALKKDNTLRNKKETASDIKIKAVLFAEELKFIPFCSIPIVMEMLREKSRFSPQVYDIKRVYFEYIRETEQTEKLEYKVQAQSCHDNISKFADVEILNNPEYADLFNQDYGKFLDKRVQEFEVETMDYKVKSMVQRIASVEIGLIEYKMYKANKRHAKSSLGSVDGMDGANAIIETLKRGNFDTYTFCKDCVSQNINPYAKFFNI